MLPKTAVCRIFFPFQTTNVAYFERKIQLSGRLVVPISPDKWSSAVYNAEMLNDKTSYSDLCHR
jgi:hypothetical protein